MSGLGGRDAVATLVKLAGVTARWIVRGVRSGSASTSLKMWEDNNTV